MFWKLGSDTPFLEAIIDQRHQAYILSFLFCLSRFESQRGCLPAKHASYTQIYTSVQFLLLKINYKRFV